MQYEMKKNKKTGRGAALLLAVIICLLSAATVKAETKVPASSDVLKAMETYVSCEEGTLLTSDILEADDSVSDWMAFDAALAGDAGGQTFLKKIGDSVTEAYKEKGCLDKVQATEYQRLVLTVLALGGDPTACGKDTDGNPVDLVKSGTYGWNGESLGLQGNNGWIYALLALDASGVEVPSDASFTREDMLAGLLEQQGENGSFGLTKGQEDVDLTAMALQALAPYVKDKTEVTLPDQSTVVVSDAVDKALDWLSAQQTDDGGFTSMDTENSESCAQTVIALTALSIDPDTDERFVNNGNSVLAALMSFEKEDGTFAHEMDGESDGMATEQALRAILSIEKRKNDDLSLYEKLAPVNTEDDSTLKGNNSLSRFMSYCIPTVVILAVIGNLVKRKKALGGK